MIVFLMVVKWIALSWFGLVLQVISASLRVSCFARADRLSLSSRLRRSLSAVILFDFIYASARVLELWNPRVAALVAGVMPVAQVVAIVLKVGAAVLCLAWATRASGLFVASLGFAIDVFGELSLVIGALGLGESIWMELPAWILIRFGLGRAANEVRVREMAEHPRPLWMEFQEAQFPNSSHASSEQLP